MKEHSTEEKSKLSRKGRDRYNSTVLWAKRSKKREEAENRQFKHDGLTLKQKIAKATKRGGSARELKRLNSLAAKEKETPIVSPKVMETPAVTESPKVKKTYRKIKKS